MGNRFSTSIINFLLNFPLINTLLFVCFNANAQIKSPQQKLDSILTVYQNYPKDDSIKLVIIKEVYRQYIRLKNFNKVDEYVNGNILLANKVNQKKYAADAYYNRGLFYHGFTNYQKTEADYQKAIEDYILINKLEMVAVTYLNLGALYNSIPDYTKALEANLVLCKTFTGLMDAESELDKGSKFTLMLHQG